MPLLGANGMPLSAPQSQDTPPSPDEPPAPKLVTTAFLVYVDGTGRVAVSDDLALPVVPARKPSFDDIIGAAANLQAEITARKAGDMAASLTVQTQLAMARQMQQSAPTQDEQELVANLMRGR